jgi:hypothetical protein
VGDLQNQCQQQEEKHQALTIELEQLRAAAKAAKNSPRNKSNNTSLPHSKSGTWVSVGNVFNVFYWRKQVTILGI